MLVALGPYQCGDLRSLVQAIHVISLLYECKRCERVGTRYVHMCVSRHMCNYRV